MTRYCRYKGIACEFATEYGYCKVTGCVKRYGDRVVDDSCKLPTVDAVPVVHGHWKEDPSGYGFWICSACGFVSEASAANMLYKFCPVCGAKMDGKDGEQNG